MTGWTFKASRLCLFCHTPYEYPLADEDQWTALALDEGSDEVADEEATDYYWRCPRCTAEGRERPRG